MKCKACNGVMPDPACEADSSGMCPSCSDFSDVIREYMSPGAVVAIAASLRTFRTRDARLARELEGIGSALTAMLGDEYNRIIEEIEV